MEAVAVLVSQSGGRLRYKLDISVNLGDSGIFTQSDILSMFQVFSPCHENF